MVNKIRKSDVVAVVSIVTLLASMLVMTYFTLRYMREEELTLERMNQVYRMSQETVQRMREAELKTVESAPAPVQWTGTTTLTHTEFVPCIPDEIVGDPAAVNSWIEWTSPDVTPLPGAGIWAPEGDWTKSLSVTNGCDEMYRIITTGSDTRFEDLQELQNHLPPEWNWYLPGWIEIPKGRN